MDLREERRTVAVRGHSGTLAQATFLEPGAYQRMVELVGRCDLQ